MAYRPAYSAHFAPETLQTVQLVDGFGSLTREWAWEGGTGKGVKVAVIDSGIDANHPAIEGGVQGYVAISEKPGNPDELVYDTAPHDDVYGHGTACAGIIRSMAPECELYSVRVLGATLGGRGQVFAAGLRWAIEHGMHVCNLSLSTGSKNFFGVLHDLADQAYYRRIMIIAAANNVPMMCYPALYSSVISVGSHDVNDPYLYYYNPAPPVEFGALGINVRVPWQKGEWITATGNSFATPHIAGIVTKILSKHPGLTPFQMKGILYALASNVVRPVPQASAG
jgi:subtilisin family serine protease